MQLTNQQSEAIASKGKTIVSASAGSGKTFVMIQKLVNSVLDGADLDEVLAMTFTKKAAGQMKDKLRRALIDRMENAGAERARLKEQLAKIQTAEISTIHAFCARLIRTYFYAAGVDSGFDIISADDYASKDLKGRALDNLFDTCYREKDADFTLLLSCFMKKRSDYSLRELVFSAYSEVRSVARYDAFLENTAKLYNPSGFGRVCAELVKIRNIKIDRLIYAVETFKNEFPATEKAGIYNKIFGEMITALRTASQGALFCAKPALTVTRKPKDSPQDSEAGELFKEFKEGVSKKYNALFADFESEETEYERFIKSGEIACAFSRVLLRFDREYTAIKAEENKLDYNDLEHLALALLQDDGVLSEIRSRYKYVYVDEYQDVNPVQEEIITRLAGETFMVGDVKQAIYGFRGSKSVFFSKKFRGFEQGEGTALKLTSNFRSADGVLNFVNGLFSDIMTQSSCGIDYKNTAQMGFGGLYPKDYGYASLHIFGKEEQEEQDLKVYSVCDDGREIKHTREGLAVLSIVERELQNKHFDLKSGKFVDTQAGDICILTRKNKGASAEGIVKALTDEGYSVAGAQETNILNLPEVKQIIDVLSLIDNAEQDIPLVTALLSPLGGFSEDELAKIRITAEGRGTSGNKKTFRRCCEEYSVLPGEISRKLNIFWGQLQRLRSLAQIMTAGELICELLDTYNFECCYGTDGQKSKNVLRIAEEGAGLSVSAFLQKLKTGGDVALPSPAVSDSIKIMSMHASKGLEFPVVIIADICKSFAGADYSEMPFDEEYGFAPKCFDRENMLAHKTVLRKLVKARSESEDLKNELNLFYVACTRAMCSLHILAEEALPFDYVSAYEAKRYAELFDMSKFPHDEIAPRGEIEKRTADGVLVSEPDLQTYTGLKSVFGQKYKYADCVDLPVKSSASALLRLSEAEKAEQPRYAEHKLFPEEGGTGTERGTAYHRFLELCDFSVKSADGIAKEIDAFTADGRLTEEQRGLLSAEELAEILGMPVFGDLHGFTLYREREFLCRLRASEVLDARSEDFVLLQGAIDLLAVGGTEVRIIDYKYSHKSDEELIQTYYKQLDLYKKAVCAIMPEIKTVKTVIVNIRKRRQVDVRTK